MTELSRQDALRVGQEVGTMAYLVHDAVAGAGVEILSFNAHQLRMIASSRKKTDRRDAYWIAGALQTAPPRRRHVALFAPGSGNGRRVRSRGISRSAVMQPIRSGARVSQQWRELLWRPGQESNLRPAA